MDGPSLETELLHNLTRAIAAHSEEEIYEGLFFC